MQRLKFIGLILFVATFAAEPLFHSHPIQSNEAIMCGVCAAGAGQITVRTPAVIAPHVVSYRLVSIEITPSSSDVSFPTASRAPPAL